MTLQGVAIPISKWQKGSSWVRMGSQPSTLIFLKGIPQTGYNRKLFSSKYGVSTPTYFRAILKNRSIKIILGILYIGTSWPIGKKFLGEEVYYNYNYAIDHKFFEQLNHLFTSYIGSMYGKTSEKYKKSRLPLMYIAGLVKITVIHSIDIVYHN